MSTGWRDFSNPTRNAAEILAGRVELKLGDMAALPYEDNRFDKVYAVQVINYLPDPLKGMKEVWRVTKRAGRGALFLEPKEKFEKSKDKIGGPGRIRNLGSALAAELHGIGITGVAFGTFRGHDLPLTWTGKEYQLEREESNGIPIILIPVL